MILFTKWILSATGCSSPLLSLWVILIHWFSSIRIIFYIFFWQNDALWSLKLFFILFFQFAISEYPRILNDDSSETAEFIKVWRTLESQLQHYDLSKAKLVSSLLHTLLFFVQYTSNLASLPAVIIVCQDMQLAFFKLFVCCCVRVSLDNYSGYFF